MEVTGTVIAVRRRRTDHGSMYVTAQIARRGTHDIRLTWLHGFEPIPARGQEVTIEGMALMFAPRRGRPASNISVFKLTVRNHETGKEQPS